MKYGNSKVALSLKVMIIIPKRDSNQATIPGSIYQNMVNLDESDPYKQICLISIKNEAIVLSFLTFWRTRFGAQTKPE